MNRKIIRCAIYTRKSSEEGLEQDFNSLDAQREAGEAYIKSQKHEGWELIPDRYDDGGYSGGNMDRPGLKKLLADIASGKIDVVVVYKVDRLTRALSDFAKIIEVFDKQNVSFVSVTQQFNTTTSMGRLTLNVLLSFAQFEREVTGERIRDKFAASKKKGMWMGGRPPLGYDVVDRKLIINEPEAEIIKYIFIHYAERNSNETLPQLIDKLKIRGYKNKSWNTQTGKYIEGNEIDLADLYRILNNYLYLGKIKFKDNIYDGEHTAIISQELWDKVQEKIKIHNFTRSKDVQSERPKLYGKIWDYHGNRMTATYSYKYSKAGRYKMRYYLNRDICKNGKTASEFKRIRADNIDKIVIEEIHNLLENLIISISRSKNQELVAVILKQLQQLKITPQNFISKVILYPQHLEVTLSLDKSEQTLSAESLLEIKNILTHKLGDKYTVNTTSETLLLLKGNIEIQYKRFGGQLFIIKNGDQLETDIEKQSYYPEDKTFIFIAKGFYWNKLIRQGVYKSSSEIAAAHDHSVEYVKRSLLQRYLSPKILKEITSNQNIKQIGVDQLMSFNNWCWEEQEKAILTSRKAGAKNKKM
jgi:DNA invertase Pin-like site-specific DNA recombinase